MTDSPCDFSIAVCGEVEALDVLVESGADAGTADVHGAFPLHYAAQMCGESAGNDMGNDVRTGLTGALDMVTAELGQTVDNRLREHEYRGEAKLGQEAGSTQIRFL